MPAIISWYEIECKAKRIIDSHDNFLTFFSEKYIFYQDFFNKWFLSTVHSNQNILIITYEDLMENPSSHLVKALNFFTPDTNININYIKQISNKIKSRRIVKNFKYFSENMKIITDNFQYNEQIKRLL